METIILRFDSFWFWYDAKTAERISSGTQEHNWTEQLKEIPSFYKLCQSSYFHSSESYYSLQFFSPSEALFFVGLLCGILLESLGLQLTRRSPKVATKNTLLCQGRTSDERAEVLKGDEQGKWNELLCFLGRFLCLLQESHGFCPQCF